MRQRKARNLETRMAAYEDWLIRDPASMKRHWRELARSAGTSGNIWLEIGCGKGKFITEIASRYPDRFYIAVEGHQTVIFRALEKAEELGLRNVCFIPQYIVDVRDWFDLGEVDGIYLNFSDPLPKNYSAKKRLTHRLKLEQYFDILSENGVVNFKTDNTGLFEFTLQEVRAMDLEMTELTWDLHRCEYDEDNIRTEYEEKFSGLGEKIKRIKVGRKPAVHGGRPEDGETMERKLTKTIFAAVNGRLLPEDEAAAAAEAQRTLAKTAVFNRYYGAVRVSGGHAAAVMTAVSNYTCPGDKVLIPADCTYKYNNIAMERGRGVETFRLEGEDRLADLEYKIRKLLRIQDRVLIVLREVLDCTAREGFGEYACVYEPEDLARILQTLNEAPQDKKVTLLIDFTVKPGEDDEAEDVGIDLKPFDGLKDNVLLLLASERQLTGVAGTEEIRDEFLRFTSFTAEACGL